MCSFLTLNAHCRRVCLVCSAAAPPSAPGTFFVAAAHTAALFCGPCPQGLCPDPTGLSSKEGPWCTTQCLAGQVHSCKRISVFQGVACIVNVGVCPCDVRQKQERAFQRSDWILVAMLASLKPPSDSFHVLCTMSYGNNWQRCSVSSLTHWQRCSVSSLTHPSIGKGAQSAP